MTDATTDETADEETAEVIYDGIFKIAVVWIGSTKNGGAILEIISSEEVWMLPHAEESEDK